MLGDQGIVREGEVRRMLKTEKAGMKNKDPGREKL